MFDILLDDANDLAVENGDFVIGDARQQTIERLLTLDKGELKQFPNVGYGIRRRLKGQRDNKRDIREMRLELEADGFSGAIVTVFKSLEDFKIEI